MTNERIKSESIALIGPASVGKSTTGEALARAIGYDFVDIDEEFKSRFGDIVEYMVARGYDEYAETNSEVNDEVLAYAHSRTVFAMPADHFAHVNSPHLVEKHIAQVAKMTSVLLLPSEDPYDTADMIADRQTARWPEATHEAEKQKYIARHALYFAYGDVRIIGNYPTRERVEIVVSAINLTH